ncbi:MAG TPA: penicillin-binding protein 2 [Myxococcota bacterium]|nr:penicillin-binding protein 2 [Myxococcota bacterium]
MNHGTGVSKLVDRTLRRVTGSASSEQRRPLIVMAAIVAGCMLALLLFVAVAGRHQLGNRLEAEIALRKAVTRTSAFKGTRGTIYDSTGNRVLAVSVESSSVGYYCGVPDGTFQRIAVSLSTALGMGIEDVTALMREGNRKGSVIFIKRHISEEEELRIRELQLPNVSIQPDSKRIYPLEHSMGVLLGFVAPDSKTWGEYVGRMGVEAAWDKVLAPTSVSVRRGRTTDIGAWRPWRGAAKGTTYSSGRTIRNANESCQHRGVDAWQLDGADLELTLDFDLQIILDEALLEAVIREEADGGMAVILDARNFNVLAMSSYPFLDPNNYKEMCAIDGKRESQVVLDDVTNPCLNKVLAFPFEPGSIAKPVGLAAGMELDSSITLNKSFDNGNGVCFIGRNRVSDKIRLDSPPMWKVIKYSSNCGMQAMASTLDPEEMRQFYIKMGLGQKSGIDVAESIGLVHKTWPLYRARSASFGYSFRATLLNMAVAYATLTNDGVRLEPKVVKTVRWPDGFVENVVSADGVKVMSAEHARDVRRALVHVVMDDKVGEERAGTGAKARPRNYTAGGKTGTAETEDESGAVIDLKCSFAGFAPANDPRVVVAVTLIRPKRNKSAAMTAAPVFSKVIDLVLPVLGVKPDRQQSPVAIRKEDVEVPR